MIRGELAGEAAPELVLECTRLRLAAGTYEVEFAGAVAARGTSAESPAAEHRTLALQGEAGPNAGRTIPCIFQLVGDRLRVCYGLDGVLPGRFEAASGQSRYLVTYRRVG